MTTAYLSVGSNLGDRPANMYTCVERLAELGKVTRVSSLYETEPMEMRDQPWFLNCVVQLETALTAHQLLKGIQKIETDLGRKRVIAKGPRTIDIDILLFGSLIECDHSLQIPHPAMHLRRFVLAPLTELAPDIVHPVLNKTARELLLELATDPVVQRLAE